MKQFERQYLQLMRKIIKKGTIKNTRNSITKSLFGEIIKINKADGFPLLTSRKLFWKGLVGELQAFMKGPKHISDFTDNGCNYWELWADNASGDIRLSYGNEWINWGSSAGNPTGINQFQMIIDSAKENLYDRRFILSGWNPDAIQNGDLSLPPCHLLYQWTVETIDGIDYLNMIYVMRSNDLMLGNPSNMMMAYLMNLIMVRLFRQNGLSVEPGDITLMLGDVHLYEDHIDNAKKQISFKNIFKVLTTQLIKGYPTLVVKDSFWTNNWDDISVDDFELINYNPTLTMKSKLFA